MAIRSIQRLASVRGYANPDEAPIYVKQADNILRFIPAGSGTSEVQLIDESSTQTLTNKTLTSPVITLPAAGLTFASGTILVEDAANVLAVRNGTTADLFRVYNTFTDASNKEWLDVGVVSANLFGVLVGAAGSGQSRNLVLGTQTSSGTIAFRIAGSSVWTINGSGNLTDNGTHTLSIGGKLASYNGITTAGQGLPAIYSAPAVSATLTANATLATYTPPSTAGVYRVQTTIVTTSGTNTGTVQATVDYKDSQAATHTGDIMFLTGANALPAVTQTGASKAWTSLPFTIAIDNSGTAIVPKVVITGSVNYTATCSIEQIA